MSRITRVKIALDYDGTYTADPEMWDAFIKLAQDRGHSIEILTMRYPSEPVPDLGIPVVYTSRLAKADWEYDIYIDDSPHWLVSDAM